MTTDPALKKLVAEADASEHSIPLTLYLPSGVLYGHTTSHDDFGGLASFHLEQNSESGCVVKPAANSEYAHLIVENDLSVDDGDDTPKSVVRVRLSDVIAWSVE